jgi:hypothetical protein
MDNVGVVLNKEDRNIQKENHSHCHFIHNKSDMNCPGVKSVSSVLLSWGGI